MDDRAGLVMGIVGVTRGVPQSEMAIARSAGERRRSNGHLCLSAAIERMMSVVVGRLGVAQDTDDELAVDGLELSAGGELECVGGDAVGVSQSALGLLVDEGEGVGAEDIALGARGTDQ